MSWTSVAQSAFDVGKSRTAESTYDCRSFSMLSTIFWVSRMLIVSLDGAFACSSAVVCPFASGCEKWKAFDDVRWSADELLVTTWAGLRGVAGADTVEVAAASSGATSRRSTQWLRRWSPQSECCGEDAIERGLVLDPAGLALKGTAWCAFTSLIRRTGEKCRCSP